MLYLQAAGETPTLPEAVHSLNVNALKGQPAHSPGQHPGSHGFIPRFIALKGQKHYMNARYYAYAPTGRALTPLCQLPRVSLRSALGYGLLPFQGVHSTCRACIQLARRAFNLQGVHSTCKAFIRSTWRAFNLQGMDSTRLRPKILQPVMVEILPDSYKNIIG